MPFVIKIDMIFSLWNIEGKQKETLWSQTQSFSRGKSTHLVLNAFIV
jgi:hypothetical protein